MTPEALGALAFQALEDPDAGVVLGDAIELSGWDDRRAAELVGIPDVRTDNGRTYVFRTSALALFVEGRRAIAAVLVFGAWPTRWPLAAETLLWRREVLGRFMPERHPTLGAIQNLLARLGHPDAVIVERPEQGAVEIRLRYEVSVREGAFISRELRDRLPAYVDVRVVRGAPHERSRI